MTNHCVTIVSKLTLALLAGLAALPASALTLSDSFSARPPSSGASVSFTGNSTAAGPELGEPFHGGNRRHTLWGSWTAPANGEVTLTTAGSAFNTVLAAYIGDALNTLQPVAANDDAAPGFDHSLITFPTKAGVTYVFAVDGLLNNSSYQGSVVLGLSFAAADQSGAEVGTDQFALRPLLPSGLTVIGTSDSRLATIELDEPAHAGSRNHSIWWRWVAPSNGAVTMDTIGSGFDTVLTVYSGATLTNLSEVAINNDAPNVLQSRLSFRARAGHEYQIMVDGRLNNEGFQGNVRLRVSLQPDFEPGAVVGADLFLERGILEGQSARGVANNTFFDQELNEPAHGSGRNHTTWWQWTAPATGLVDIRTEGSDFDTYLVVYTGNSITSLTPVAANNDQPNVTWSRVQFLAQQGVSYRIMVDGRLNNSSFEGNIQLSVNQAVVPENTLRLITAVEVELPGLRGVLYQLQSSTDLVLWANEGAPIAGTGQPIRILQTTRDTAKKFYRYLSLP